VNLTDPISIIPGIGPKKQKSLSDAGYSTIGDLMVADFYDVMRVPEMGSKSTSNVFRYIGRRHDYISMKEIVSDIGDFITIENKNIYPWSHYKTPEEMVSQPSDFKLENTTVWSFPNRGDWATHTPHYRGNWSPRVVRNVIERYSKPNDVVLDPMVGGGTTAIEAILTGRNSISSDINPGAIAITQDRLKLPANILSELPETVHRFYVGDVRNLDKIPDESIDLIATHPPYVNIIRYTQCVDGDLSQFNDYNLFFEEFRTAISEFYRVLKPGKYCAVLIGDTHNRGHFVPISGKVMMDFLKAGFLLKEDVIKREWNCESDRNLKKYANSDFLLTMHEHLFIFRKPKNDEKKIYKNSSAVFFE